MLTCLSNNKKMFLVPVLLLKYIFSFFNSVFLLLFCFYFFKHALWLRIVQAMTGSWLE